MSRTIKTTEQDSSKPVCYLVLAMHRSGSSALTWALSRMGAGLPKNIVGANNTNKYGHWEPEKLLRLHDKLLLEAGSSWDDWRQLNLQKLTPENRAARAIDIGNLIKEEYSFDRPFVLKEPRVCRFSDFYLDILEQNQITAKVVIGLRNPLAVMGSLKARNDMPESKGALLWLRHMLDAEFASRGYDRVIVDYDGFMESPEEVIKNISNTLGGFNPNTVEAAIAATSEFVHPKQRHHERQADELELHALTSSWVQETYKALITLQTAPKSVKAKSTLDTIRNAFNNVSPIIERISRDFQKQNEQVLKVTKDKLVQEYSKENASQEVEKKVQELNAKLASSDLQSSLEKKVLENQIDRQNRQIGSLEEKLMDLSLSLAATKQKSKLQDQQLADLGSPDKLLNLSNTIEKQIGTIAELREKFAESQALNKRQKTDLLALHESEMLTLKEVRLEMLQAHAQQMDSLKSGHAKELEELKANLAAWHANEVKTLKDAHAETLQEYKDETLVKLQKEVAEVRRQKKAFEAECSRLRGIRKNKELELANAHRINKGLNKTIEKRLVGLEREVLRKEKALNDARKQYRASERRNLAYYNSFSWKVTRPIRGVKRLFTEKGFAGEALKHMFPSVSPALSAPPVKKQLASTELVQNLGQKPSRINVPSDNSHLAEDPLNCSTYNAARPYPFLTAEKLDENGQVYLKALQERKRPARVAIFMAITGGYDGLKYHEHLMPDVDYFIFGETEFEAPYVYKYKKIPHFDEEPTRIARFVKTHAHTLMADYDIAIWVDGNIIIRDDLTDLIQEFKNSGHAVGAIPHPIRTDVYAEANECIARGKDNDQAIKNQMDFYKSKNFKTDALIESNFIMFRPQDARTRPFLETWWSQIDNGSRRDQLSLNYALQTNNVSYYPITDRPNSVRNHPKLALLQHGAESASKPTVNLPENVEAAKWTSYAEVRDARIQIQADRKIDVVVCVHNALEVVVPCLESVLATRNEKNHHIIIVDDGSAEETRDYLAGFVEANNNIQLVRHAKAGGYTKAANAGLKASKGELVVLLNSDTVVSANWLEKMADAVFSRPGCGVVGPMSNAASSQSVPEHRSSKTQTVINKLPEGLTPQMMDEWCEKNSDANFLPYTSLVHGFCFGVTREMLNRIGGFDEDNFPTGYGEENDFCLRAVANGMSLVIATHTYVFHVKSSSYTPEARVPLMKAGNTKLRDLHGNERVARAIRSLQNNPYLADMRSLAGKFYNSKGYKI